MISIGIDTHKASLTVSAFDELGRQLATRTVGNDPRGHAALLAWIQRQAPPRRVGIEGAGSFGAALAEVLVAAGEVVVEGPPSSPTASAARSCSVARAIPATRWPSPA